MDDFSLFGTLAQQTIGEDDLKSDELKHIPLALIRVNPYQPRREFKSEDLKELAQSISSVGLLHPPLVRRLPESDLYELISGERRFRAAQLANLSTIAVYIRSTNYCVSAQAALIENIQRVDLNSLEIARALKRLITEFGLTQDQLSHQLGKKRSTLANYLRLLTLPSTIQESLSKDFITMGHAKAILALDEEAKQMLLHEIILRDDLNVRQAEQAAQRIGEKAKKQQLSYIPRDFYLEELEGKIREKLGTKVFIQPKGKKGRILIDYYNLDDLDRLLILFGVKEER
ncbi:MAG: ParB/RepB/Spo0J family partition protein [Parachlamydiaceae bacterium]